MTTPWAIVWPLALGAIAIYMLLPRPKPFPTLIGGATAGAALLLAGFLLIRTEAISPENVLFYCFSGIALAAGGSLVTQQKPAYAALSFALVVLSTCGLFLLQAAPFLMAATIIIYAGAIIVTFLFVLMLSQQDGPSDADDRSREPLLSTIAGFVLLGALLYVLSISITAPSVDPAFAPFLERARAAAKEETPEQIASTLGGTKFFQEFEKAVYEFRETINDKQAAAGLETFREQLEGELRGDWQKAETTREAAPMRAALTKVDEAAAQARQAFAASAFARTAQAMQPPADTLPLSPFSGPPSNRPIARDARGDAALPAANVEALGRSLYTDFLLAVELGGTLLLVATVGAIAIATRHGERQS